MGGRLAGKACVITGAGGGMGRDAALLFTEEGAKVCVADVSLDAAEETVGHCAGEAFAVRANVAEEEDVRRMCAAAADRFGGIDVLCPNAGVFVGPDRPLEETPDDTIDLLIDVNIRGVVNVLRAGLPHVRPGGAVILTSSSRSCRA